MGAEIIKKRNWNCSFNENKFHLVCIVGTRWEICMTGLSRTDCRVTGAGSGALHQKQHPFPTHHNSGTNYLECLWSNVPAGKAQNGMPLNVLIQGQNGDLIGITDWGSSLTGMLIWMGIACSAKAGRVQGKGSVALYCKKM